MLMRAIAKLNTFQRSGREGLADSEEETELTCPSHRCAQQSSHSKQSKHIA